MSTPVFSGAEGVGRCLPRLLCSSVNGHVDYFHFLAVRNSATGSSPGGIVVRTRCFYRCGPGVNPWPGNRDPTSSGQTPWLSKEKRGNRAAMHSPCQIPCGRLSSFLLGRYVEVLLGYVANLCLTSEELETLIFLCHP